MELTKESIMEFKAIYKAEFGKELTEAEAQEMGEDLLQFYWMILPKKK
jgi:hypothetical protein